MSPLPFITCMIVPTGIGASIGGYGGDASVAMGLLASVSDTLITHPNVANAAIFSALPHNAMYVEGYALDRFFIGEFSLEPVRNNRIGIVFDARIEPDMLTLHRNVIAAVSTVYGITIVGETVTDVPLQLLMEVSSSGVSTGGLKNPDILYRACKQLIDSQGATALAICAELPGMDNPELEKAYEAGQGVDPIGGLEAILSHAIVARFQIPCAHAPVFQRAAAEPTYDRLVHPKAASEYIAPTFLPCVLQGLAPAPQFLKTASMSSKHSIVVQDLNALVVPANCMGGIPMLVAVEAGIPMVVVGNNSTLLSVTLEALWGSAKVDFLQSTGKLYPVNNYTEAAGVLQSLKMGWVCPP